MKRRVITRPRVAKDLAAHYACIAQDKIAPAERLLLAAQRTFELLAMMPGSGRRWESPQRKLHGVHVYPIMGFRSYLVFYRWTDDVLEILAILHGARDLQEVLRHLVDDP